MKYLKEMDEWATSQANRGHLSTRQFEEAAIDLCRKLDLRQEHFTEILKKDIPLTGLLNQAFRSYSREYLTYIR